MKTIPLFFIFLALALPGSTERVPQQILPATEEIGLWQVVSKTEATPPEQFDFSGYPALSEELLAEFKLRKLSQVTYHDEMSGDHITCLALDFGTGSPALGLYSYLTGDMRGSVDIPCLVAQTENGLVYQKDRYVVILSSQDVALRTVPWMKTFCRRMYGKIIGGCGQPGLMQILPTRSRDFKFQQKRYGLGPLAFDDLFSPGILKLLELGQCAEAFTCTYQAVLTSGRLFFVRYPDKQHVQRVLENWTAYYRKLEMPPTTVSFGTGTTYMFREQDGTRRVLRSHGPYLLAAMGSKDAVGASQILEQATKKIITREEKKK